MTWTDDLKEESALEHDTKDQPAFSVGIAPQKWPERERTFR